MTEPSAEALRAARKIYNALLASASVAFENKERERSFARIIDAELEPLRRAAEQLQRIRDMVADRAIGWFDDRVFVLVPNQQDAINLATVLREIRDSLTPPAEKETP